MKDIYFLFASNFPGLSNCLMFGHGTGNCFGVRKNSTVFVFQLSNLILMFRQVDSYPPWIWREAEQHQLPLCFPPNQLVVSPYRILIYYDRFCYDFIFWLRKVPVLSYTSIFTIKFITQVTKQRILRQLYFKIHCFGVLRGFRI